ncbi:oxidoreductase protein [Tanticharoenia sakaeratensis NBRC 103193]|uniref:Oxidoreductase protein n=2 Tax=Tanticharoenia TaxID=444052 RepID=A0A0D6ML32_9PROT|nr:oxidoreductase protein [Tanticharoenia sakaeratensis NBRC 103193]GBQ18922.1 3-chlorobenzoate-3-4-dioxygenase oxygenase subunit [Tanticharoenia sakaeratensis NBRC 103193]
MADMTMWHPVALGADIPAGTVAPVRLHGDEVVLWRDEAGILHAWEDRCPHRGMRLSFGFVRKGRLACLYHGWQFDGEGRCRHIPAHPDLSPPGTIRARTWRADEAHGFVWLAHDGSESLPAMKDGAFTAARSIAIESARGTVAAALGIGQDPVLSRDGLICAVHAADGETTMLHVAVANPADAADAALWAQRTRDSIERGEAVAWELHL